MAAIIHALSCLRMASPEEEGTQSAYLDGLLGVAKLSPAELLDTVLDEEDGASCLAAVLLLLKRADTTERQLERAVRKLCLPALAAGKGGSASGSAPSQIVDSVAEVVSAKRCWQYATDHLLPLCYRSIGLQQFEGLPTDGHGLAELDPSKACQLAAAVIQEANAAGEREEKERGAQSEDSWRQQSLPEATMMDGPFESSTPLEGYARGVISVQSAQLGSKVGGVEPPGDVRQAQQSAVELFLRPLFAALKQNIGSSLRAQIIQSLLPPLLEAAVAVRWTAGLWGLDQGRLVAGDDEEVARSAIRRELWGCCTALLTPGGFTRSQGYELLAVFARWLLPPFSGLLAADLPPNASTASRFDVRAEAGFWEAIRSGLVDSDALTRKRSLRCLKAALPTGVTGQLASTGLPGKERKPAPQEARSHDSRSSRSSSRGVPPPVPHSDSAKASELGHVDDDLDAHGAGADSGPPAVGGSNDAARDPAGSRRGGGNRNGGEKALDTDKRTRQEARHFLPDAASHLYHSSLARWQAFLLLFDTLEEYGLWLAEAAWERQMEHLIPRIGTSRADDAAAYRQLAPDFRSELDVSFAWIAVLWQRGFEHTNPQVRRLIVESFWTRDWLNNSCIASVSQSFVLGPLLRVLDDPNLHSGFGVGESYSSETAVAAVDFFGKFAAALDARERANFVGKLVPAIVDQAPTRSGFMTLVMTLEAAATCPAPGPERMGQYHGQLHAIYGTQCDSCEGAPEMEMEVATGDTAAMRSRDELLDGLRGLVEESKKHFNPLYRAKACGHIFSCARAFVRAPATSLLAVAQLVSSFSASQLGPNGPLLRPVRAWLYSEPGPGVDTWLKDGLQGIRGSYFAAGAAEPGASDGRGFAARQPSAGHKRGGPEGAVARAEAGGGVSAQSWRRKSHGPRGRKSCLKRCIGAQRRRRLREERQGACARD